MKLSLKEKVYFAFGNLGIALVTVLHMLFLVYFFYPTKEMGIPVFIPQDSLVLGMTVLGLIMFSSRIFDIITDPIIAYLSDHSKNKKGKRLPFMAKATVPMAVSFVAVFFVPYDNGISLINFLWLGVFLFLSALFHTFYSIPYYSLMVDMARSPEDKVDLGTFSSAFWFAGFLVVSFTSSIWHFIENITSFSRLTSMQLAFCIMGALGILALFIPVVFLNESKYSIRSHPNPDGIITSLKQVSKNENFMIFAFSNLVYGTATYIFETGLLYYITVLALLNETIQGPLTTLIGILTLGCYPLINKLSKKVGRKFVMIIGFLLFGLSFIVISILGIGSISVYVLLGIIALLAPFSHAAFGILPGVVTADCAAYDLKETTINRSAMYMAVTNFTQKLGGSIGMLAFTGFLVLGKDVDNDIGIRYAAIFTVILCLVGLVSILRYDEQTILSYREEGEKSVS